MGMYPARKGGRQNPANEETRRINELLELRMKVELLQNFLSEAGRR
jgi:hypothetical protein